MTLHKSMWKAAVLMGIAGVLVFAGGTQAQTAKAFKSVTVACKETGGDNVKAVYGTAWTQWWTDNASKCKVSAIVDAATSASELTVTTDYTIALASSVTGNVTASSGNVSLNLTITAAGTNTISISTTAGTTPGGNVTVAATLSGDKATVNNTMIEVRTTGGKDTVAGFEDRIYNKSAQTFAAADVKLKAALGLTGLGAVTLKYAKVTNAGGTTFNAFSTTAPTDTGRYLVMAVFGSGTNFKADSILIRGSAAVGSPNITKIENSDKGLEIKFDAGLADWVFKNDYDFEYNPKGEYTVPWPTVLSDFFGVLDTIVISPLTQADWTGSENSAKTQKIVHATPLTSKSFLLTANDTGELKITVKVRGQKKDGTKITAIWETPDIEFKVIIEPRNLGTSLGNADDITVSVLGDNYVYSGDSVVPKITNIIVRYKGDPIGNANTANYILPANDAAATAKSITWKSKDGTTGDWNRIQAGTASVFVIGDGKFKGVARGDYNIGKKPITFSIKGTVYSKEYDGTRTLDTNSFTRDPATGDFTNTANTGKFVEVQFATLGTFNNGTTTVTDILNNVRDYNITKAELDDPNVGTNNRTASVSVALAPDGPAYKNYTLTNVTVTQSNRSVTKLTPTDANFTFSIPADTVRFFNNNRQAVGSAALKTPLTNGTGTVTLRYVYGTHPTAGIASLFNSDNLTKDSSIFNPTSNTTPKAEFEGDTTLAPKAAGTYGVIAVVAGNGPNIENGTYKLGVYKINPPAAPSFDIDAPSDGLGQTSKTPAGDIRQTNSFTLSVTAKSPNGGTLSYKWFEEDKDGNVTEVREDGKSVNKSSVTVMAAKQGTFNYYAEVTNVRAGVQVPVMVQSTKVSVTVIDPPTRLNGTLTVIAPDAGWVYTGTAIEPSGAQVTVTQVDENGVESPLTESTDYSLEYSNNIGVGKNARVTVRGTNNYNGSLSQTFEIVQKVIDPSDFNGNWKTVYTGAPAVVNVRTRSPMTGMGAIKVFYAGSETVPTDAGKYDVEVTVAEGTNFKGTGTGKLLINTLEIAPKVPVLADFLAADGSAFKIPTGHKEGVTTAFGVPAGTKLKGTGYGDITILYDGSDIVPTTRGVFAVTADIAVGDNYEAAVVTLGTYTIIGEGDAVAESNREVPKSGETNVVSVAPVKVTPSAKLTAGPSPVKLGGEITFFSKSNGSIYIFDASGSNVAKVPAKSGKAVWNLKDKKGVTVSEGTYVAVAKDGREKVSFKFSVVK